MKAVLHSAWRVFKWYRDTVAWSSQRRRSKLKGRHLPGIGLELAILATFGGVGIGHILLALGVI